MRKYLLEATQQAEKYNFNLDVTVLHSLQERVDYLNSIIISEGFFDKAKEYLRRKLAPTEQEKVQAWHKSQQSKIDKEYNRYQQGLAKAEKIARVRKAKEQERQEKGAQRGLLQPTQSIRAIRQFSDPSSSLAVSGNLPSDISSLLDPETKAPINRRSSKNLQPSSQIFMVPTKPDEKSIRGQIPAKTASDFAQKYGDQEDFQDLLKMKAEFEKQGQAPTALPKGKVILEPEDEFDVHTFLKTHKPQQEPVSPKVVSAPSNVFTKTRATLSEPPKPKAIQHSSKKQVVVPALQKPIITKPTPSVKELHKQMAQNVGVSIEKPQSKKLVRRLPTKKEDLDLILRKQLEFVDTLQEDYDYSRVLYYLSDDLEEYTKLNSKFSLNKLKK